MAAHEAAGEALEHVYRGAIDAHLPELAHHFLSAAPRGDHHKAVDYAQRAAAARARQPRLRAGGRAVLARARGADAARGRRAAPRGAAARPGHGAVARGPAPAARDVRGGDRRRALDRRSRQTFARAALGAAPFALTRGVHRRRPRRAARRRRSTASAPATTRCACGCSGSLAAALYWSDASPRRVELVAGGARDGHRLGDDVTLAFALSSGAARDLRARQHRAGARLAADAVRAERARGTSPR